MTEQHKITKAATTIGMGTLLSRILGFLRDVVIANFFGAGMAADAFFVAFRLPNLWRRLVGEGSMAISFIPIYTEYLTRRSEEESKELTHIAFTLAGTLLAILTILGIVFAPLFVRIIAPGWVEKFPESFRLTVTLSQIIFPYIFFMGLFALAMGMLNSRRHFFAPSFAPVFLNICMILSVLLFFVHLNPPVLTLAFGVLAGGLLQFLFQIPFLLKKGISFRFNFDVRHPAIRRIGLLMVPGVIGTAVYQLNVFIDTIFASFLPRGSVSYLFYADRLMEFPLGIFAVAMGMAALPSFSELASRGRKEELSETVSFAFRLVSFISVPALVGLIALKTPIINLLLQRGQFDEHATQMTARALLCYCVGLWAIAGVRTVAPAFYALQDMKTPLKIGAVCLGANVVFIAALIAPLQHAGLALATSFSSILNLVLLSRELRKALGRIDFRKNIKSLMRHLACSVPMGLVAYLICSSGRWTQAGDSLPKLFLLMSGIVVGVGVYLACSWFIRDEEMLFLLKMMKRKGRS